MIYLKLPLEIVVKRIATMEVENGGMLEVASVSESSQGDKPTSANKQVSEIKEIGSYLV